MTDGLSVELTKEEEKLKFDLGLMMYVSVSSSKLFNQCLESQIT